MTSPDPHSNPYGVPAQPDPAQQQYGQPQYTQPYEPQPQPQPQPQYNQVYTPAQGGQLVPTEQPNPYATPAQGTPYGAYAQPRPQPQQQPRRKPPILVLSIVAAVLAVVAGVFTVLYVTKNGELGDTTAARAGKDGELAGVKDDQAKADKGLSDNKSKESSLKDEHDLLTQCVDATKAYFALPAGQTPESSRLFRIMYDICPKI
ncbi:hypothetical protein GCM10022243_38730 [Saccharothrix violaceirubra]|uniref:Uncharacterized protein n=1 Tax=Saccharothrix violaceirubra TaxID=413306 RepID=A0A7W7T0H2_9PSEU|nr:hypothetical protein [Saccharothrix violaceirubra]MBB4964342.1 hypothetical protein [Saccharothrix violaceirubra]